MSSYPKNRKSIWSRTDEVKQKIRNTLLWHFVSDDTKKKIGESWIWRKHSEETKKKMSEQRKWKKLNRKKNLVQYNKWKKWLFHHSEDSKKKISEKLRGEKSYLWKWWLSLELYPPSFNNILKNSIRKRDWYTCVICLMKQKNKKFHVHHIDYNKQNCDSTNLITLCHNCHAKTNWNREYWTDYFNNKKYERRT